MANIKQEEEEPSDACSMSLLQLDIPKHELMDIKVEPQEFSEMRSEFDLPSSVDRQSIDLPSSIAPLDRLVHTWEGKGHLCLQCGKIFTRSSDVTRHLRTHTGEKPFVCSVCAKGFSQKSSLNTHQHIHTGEKPFACKWCDKKFVDSSQRTRHERIHTGEKPYTCKWCEKRFADSCNLTSHERRHTGEKPYQCKWCDQRFFYSGQRTRHQRIHDGGNHTPAGGAANLLQEHTNRAHEGPKFPCSLCDHVAKSNAILKRHERLVHRGEGKDHVCPDCNKGFTSNYNLQNHIRIHTGEKPFMCSVCAKGFSKKSHLKGHEHIHTVDKPYTCRLCDKRFAVSNDLTSHERRHTGEKPYQCKWCDKRFFDSSQRTRHQRIHDGRNHAHAGRDSLAPAISPHMNECILEYGLASVRSVPIGSDNPRIFVNTSAGSILTLNLKSIA